MQRPIEAQTHDCPSCGAPVTWLPEVRAQACPHCTQTIELDAVLAAELSRRGEAADENLSAELKARWVGTFYRAQQAAATPVIVGITAGVSLLTGFLLMLIAGEVTLVVQLPALLITVAILEWATRGMIAAYAMPTMQELAAVRVVRCGKCGGTGHVMAGKDADRCQYCSSHVLSPANVAAELLDELAAAQVGAATEEVRSWDEAIASGDRWVKPAVVGVFVAVLLVFPAVFAAAWYLSDIAPLHAGWACGVLVLYVIGAITRWVRTLTATSAARRTMEAQLEERVRRLARRHRRPMFDASLGGRDEHGTDWLSDGALIVRAALVDSPPAPSELTAHQIATVRDAVDGARRTALAQWMRQGVGDYFNDDGVRLAHGYMTLLRELERSTGVLALVSGSPRSPIGIEVDGARVGVVMPRA